ncbi:MAG TPA: porin family protein [Burkholderiaceae bacterium]|nr:porin family protein [Burkholderiaceae bacterium]HSB98610.1 porin family protein [Burkholderiaceae bacterium]
MHTRHALVFGSLLAAAATAGAQQLYFGAGGGVTHTNADCTGTVSCETSDNGWKAYAGYHINPLWSVEVLGYDMGTSRGAVDFPGFGLVNSSLKTTGFGLASAVTLPLGGFADFYGRLGVGSNTLKIDVSGSLGNGSDSESSAQLLWGVGLGFRVSPNVSIRTEIDGTSATYAGERFDSTLWSIGASFRF